ncbi:aldehyde dehydrogenase family protein [Pseudomonas sp.]|uniref:aldehyde dehydrogenase family protein n=1 Tax=Pseudomonas sp. TaxID=306 RepID=UPI00248A6272|nr:aldehyde dehydrogenase family protein [Pseudomonas sp.]MDI1332507.1 aldehyde dehydrogenase family protein [Pseudomonas sp.]
MTNQHYIGGKWRSSKSGKTIEVFDPSTGMVFTNIAAGDRFEINAAVNAAQQALTDGWKNTTGTERAEILRRIAKGVRDNAESLALLESRDNGKPLVEARYDVADAAVCFDYYADLAEQFESQTESPISVPDDRFQVTLQREPAGVVGLIVPWNFPLVTAAWKVAPALAAGCTVVLKPSEFTSLSALELAKIAGQASLPAGVLNIVTGYGHEAGAALADHAGVRRLSFTGGVSSGQAVMTASARHVRDVALELGGKSAMIIFDDVDIDRTVEWIMMGVFYNQGQVCSATSRLIVQDRIFDRLVDRLRAASKLLRIGSGLNEDTQMGPLASEAHLKRVSSLVEQGREAGAEISTLCELPPNLPNGYFFAPLLVVDPLSSNPLWCEEIFGPVLCMVRFADEDQAVKLANDTQYGLAAAVISKDLQRCERVARHFEAGIVWVNCSQPVFIQAPWGGMKQSGFKRGLGHWGLDEFTELKQVTRYRSGDYWGHYPMPN